MCPIHAWFTPGFTPDLHLAHTSLAPCGPGRLYIEFFNLRRRVGEWKHWEIGTHLLARMIRAQMKARLHTRLTPDLHLIST